MISQTRLRQLARELDVRLGYAEKNYVNSWILWAIYTGSYGENLLFKGGTALSKLYFPRYRAGSRFVRTAVQQTPADRLKQQ